MRNSKTGKPIDELRGELFREDPELERSWRDNASRRELSMALVAMRKAEGLTQRRLADRLGWKQPQVARLESATGPWPHADSLRAYASACGRSVGLVFAHVEGAGHVHIDGAIAFGQTEDDKRVAALKDADIEVAD